jgi:hypothetical protein
MQVEIADHTLVSETNRLPFLHLIFEMPLPFKSWSSENEMPCSFEVNQHFRGTSCLEVFREEEAAATFYRIKIISNFIILPKSRLKHKHN